MIYLTRTSVMMFEAHLKKIWVFLAAFALVFAMINSAQFFALGQEVRLDEIKSSYHAIIIESPKNGSIYIDKKQIPLNITVDYIYTERYVPWRVLNRLFYSIDDELAKLLTTVSAGYTTPIPYRYGTEIDISSLSNGSHKIKVIAEFAVDVSHVYVTSYNYSSSPASFSAFRDQPPSISIMTPENKTYELQNIPLNFTLSEQVSKIAFSLDGQDNITISGNTTLTDLSGGFHNITVYAWDNAGNIGFSKTVVFTIVEKPEPELDSFPIVPVATSIATVAIVGIGLLVYFKRRKQQKLKT
jgi:hypothetical protein